MEHLFLECSARAALIVLATALVLYVMRVRSAALRHHTWTGILLVMLMLPAWTAWGPKAPVRVLPPLIDGAKSIMAPVFPSSTVYPANTNSRFSDPGTRPLKWKWQPLFLGVYLFGLFTLLFRLAIGTVKAQKLIRNSRFRDGKRISFYCAAPVTVGLLFPQVILPEHCGEWPQRQLDAVLTHEGEHVRRHDPLVQWMALFNRAVFWFHPAAWWLQRELSMLAEQACDTAVLAKGHDPREYSEYLMDIARSVMHSRTRVNVAGVAMPGGFLPQRIRRIMEGGPVPHLSPPGIVGLIAACTITCTIFAAGKLDHARPSLLEGSQKAAFDIVSVKSNGSGDEQVVVLPQDDGHYKVTNAPLSLLIALAYQPLQRYAMFGMPDWADSARFDLEIEEGKPIGEQMNLILRSLLASRFKLVVHHEVRELPVYALVALEPHQTGPGLLPHSSDSACPDPLAPSVATANRGSGDLAIPCGGFMMSTVHLSGLKIPVNMLAAQLSELVDRAVVDRSDLSGTFDLNLEYGSKSFAGNGGFSSSRSPLFAAVREQLGLELEPQMGPFDVLVIDHVELPSEN